MSSDTNFSIHFQSALEKTIYSISREEEEEKYLQNLAKSYIQDKPKSYALARSIILDIHFSLNYYMSVAISLSCVLYRVKEFNKNELSGITEAFQEVGFYDKINIVKKLKIFSNNSLETLCEVNHVRNAFAHGYKETSAKYNYRNKSIFKRESIDRLVSEHKTIAGELADFIKGDEK
ncbi:MAG: hypothetical protein NTV07_00960 [Candidatus Omnitrophica bacterium]|nr:hypothetical protein [Candidatus Omnitrophota bacterium]